MPWPAGSLKGRPARPLLRGPLSFRRLSAGFAAERLPGPIQSKHQGVGGWRVWADAEADVLLAEASSAICVQRFDDSRNSAIHTTYRISLRSSSVREPRHPLLRVVSGFLAIWHCQFATELQTNDWFGVVGAAAQPSPARGRRPAKGAARPKALASEPPDVISRGDTPGAPRMRGVNDWFTRCLLRAQSDSREARERIHDDSMIPPQVHLRRPCYDFSFL